ncbi:cytochrome P450 [Phanerochaete sordida]|uniref:Cytochrome P450 n=1 Tax=Phanerochaete sordida TaxID=48140 RepID=A0A9P3LJE5_9APHY|nr:cytochrome P450 [Phanerochaete sordida]
MSLAGSAAPWAVSGVVLWLAWKLLRRYLPSPLDNIPGPRAHSLLKGSMDRVQKRDAWPFLDELTDDYGQVVKLTGILGRRVLWIFDPLALHHVLIKDQDIYEEAPLIITGRKLFVGPGVMSTVGAHHRRQRKMLNPVFSTAHMRRLTPLFHEVAHRLRAGIDAQLAAAPDGEVDVLGWTGRAALELIGQGGFGHSFDPLVADVPNAYARAIKDFIPTAAGLVVFIALLPLFRPLIAACDARPALAAAVGRAFDRVPHAGLRRIKAIKDVLDRTSHAIYAAKKAALAGDDAESKMRVVEGRDLMSVLLRENMNVDAADRLPEREIIAQITTFTFAGTDTTSNALARILHLLCLHPAAQETLRAELRAARAAHGAEDLAYDALAALPYLDAVCRETLRLYPPVAFVFRVTAKATLLPLSAPLALRDGTTTRALHVPARTTCVVAIHSANRSRAVWGADARAWRPERWLDGAVPEVRMPGVKMPGVYANLMTFTGGGRSCIGFKFSQLEMKVVLAMLVSSYRLALAPGTEIVWNRAPIAYPTVGKIGTEARLPLRLERVGA